QDSVYVAMDKTGIPVTVGNDSTNMTIDYITNGDTVTITFNPTPRNTYTALEALEKIKEQAAK
ncbi:MAG: hypothetical protein K2H71_09330, partial [Muribaculaceae bacterium]|nr:hypothetical protein [Muribaculaceae bacterium]